MLGTQGCQLSQSLVLSVGQSDEDGLELGTGQFSLECLQLQGGASQDICSNFLDKLCITVADEAEFLQPDRVALTDEHQERIQDVLTSGGTDPDLRDETDHPGLEQILRLLRILLSVHTEPGPLPEQMVAFHSQQRLP